MNDYDKVGRYLVKREPAGFFRWLSGNPDLSFNAWIDARRVALPVQSDLTNDLVAAVYRGKVQEAICLELEAEARADAGLITQVLAALAGCRPAWVHGLRGWNMKTSPVLDEIRAELREEIRDQVQEEVRTLCRAEGIRETILRLGRRKFGKAPNKKQQKALETVSDIGQIEALAERLLAVHSWGDLLGES